MATMKPGALLKDQLIRSEAARLAKRASSERSLLNLLTSIPKVDPEAVSPAIDALMDAADQYKASQPLVDPKGRRSKPSIADARTSVAALLKHLVKAQEQLSNLPLDAMSAIGQAIGVPLDEMRCISVSDDDALDLNFRAAIGKIAANLEQARQAVERAQNELVDRPHKVADTARNMLAYQVAVVFTDILHKKPASTSERQLKGKKSRGAAYARALRVTLKIAGVTDYDSDPVISAGLRLLKDQNLPSRV